MANDASTPSHTDAEAFPTGQNGGTDGRTLRKYTYDGGRRLTKREVGILSGSFSATASFSGSPEVTDYGYDDANRLTARTYADGLDDAFSYDDAGRLLTADSERYRVNVARVYDDASRLTSESQQFLDGTVSGTTVSAATYTVTTSYDNDNRLTGITYPTSDTVARTYTDRNELDTVRWHKVDTQPIDMKPMRLRCLHGPSSRTCPAQWCAGDVSCAVSVHAARVPVGWW